MGRGRRRGHGSILRSDHLRSLAQGGAAAGRGEELVLRYIVEVENGLDTSLYGGDDAFAALVDATRPAHREFIASQLSLGRIVGSGPYTDGTRALIILQLPDTATEADAAAVLDDDPYTVAGALEARDVHEWNPVTNIFS